MNRLLKAILSVALVVVAWGAVTAAISFYPGDDPPVGGGGNIAAGGTTNTTAMNVLGSKHVMLLVTATNTVKCSVFTWQVSNDSTNWTAATAYANQVLVKSDSIVDARLDLGGRTSSLLPAANVPYIPFRWARVAVIPYRANDQAMTGLGFEEFILRELNLDTQTRYR